MIQSETLPTTLTLAQASLVLNLSLYDVRALVTTRQLQSSSYEVLPTAAVGKYLVEVKGLFREEAELLIATTLFPIQDA